MTYIIVVDVCNNRARKAYQKGLEDLALVWDQLMLAAKKQDDLAEEQYQKIYTEWQSRYEKAKAKEKAEEDRYLAELDVYEASLKKCNSSFFGSSSHLSRPLRPFPSFDSTYMYRTKPYHYGPLVQKHHESIKQELTNKYNLADVAIGPFRMTEGDVKKMIAWEDGSEVAKLLEGINNPLSRTHWEDV